MCEDVLFHLLRSWKNNWKLSVFGLEAFSRMEACYNHFFKLNILSIKNEFAITRWPLKVERGYRFNVLSQSTDLQVK